MRFVITVVLCTFFLSIAESTSQDLPTDISDIDHEYEAFGDQVYTFLTEEEALEFFRGLIEDD